MPSLSGGQSLPPIAPDSCGRGIRAEFLISNRSPTSGPKLVGGFHLPSAVCPPSVFGETPSDRVLAEATSARRPRRARLHDTQSTSRGPKLVGRFRLPSNVSPPSGRLPHLRATFGVPSGPFAANLAARSADLSAFRPPSQFDVGLLSYGMAPLPRPVRCALW